LNSIIFQWSFELVQNLFVARVGWIRARVDKNSNWDSRLPPGNNLVRDRRVLHEPVGDIDPHLFVIDETPQRSTAILECGITQTLLRLR
jgi:hypothetical protein